MSNKDENKKIIETNWKDKDGNKYKIKVEVGKTETIEAEKGKDDKKGSSITVKGISSGFFQNKFMVGDKEVKQWTKAFWGVTIGGSALFLILVIGLVMFFRKKKNKKEGEAL